MRKAPWKQFLKDLKLKIAADNVSNGAGALAFFLMLAIFPAAIFLLSLLPYLPIPNLQQAIMDLLRQALPGEAASLFTGVVEDVASQRRGGLLSFGAIATLWAASSGMYAIMQQLNVTYDAQEKRPIWKARGIALLLTLLFAVLVIGAFTLIIFGGALQGWAGSVLGRSRALLTFFQLFRWLVIAAILLIGFALIYHFGPDVSHRFRVVTPGGVLGVVLLALASLAFRLYVANFGKYSATYGSLGAAIVLMLWLYLTGWIILLGSEINALLEKDAHASKDEARTRKPDRPRAGRPQEAR